MLDPNNNQPVSRRINVADLHFDPENPRFAFKSDTPRTDSESFSQIIKTESIEELVRSIGEQSYFPGEPLLVTQKSDSNTKYVVVEGNRRLAALKILNNFTEGINLSLSLKAAAESAKIKSSDVSSVDCMVFSKRSDILPYLGFKHVTGTKSWDSLAKARYLQNLIDNFYNGLPVSDQHKALARDIGSKSHHVRKMLIALQVFNDAQSHNFYDIQGLKEEDISFSFIPTAMGYNEINDFLNLKPDAEFDISQINRVNAKLLFSWMFKENESNRTVLGESRNLKFLAQVVSANDAVEKLKEGKSIEYALQYVGEPIKTALDQIERSKKSVDDCQSYINLHNVEVDESHKNIAEKLVDSSDVLLSLINKSIRRRAI